MTHDDLMQRYLQRLGMGPPPAPTWGALKELVSAHLERIPFENLDVIGGREADLSTAGTLHKLVIRRRGGFCYELNEAFGALLTYLGFSVIRIEARVWSPVRQAFGPPFDHLALVVSLPEGDFLTDVGFGDNNRTPLRIPVDSLTDVSGRYTLGPRPGGLWVLARPDRPLYELTLTPRELNAFEAMYHFHRSSPDSFFTQGLICTRATRTGRITLNAERLSIVEGANRSEVPAMDRDRTLEQYFGVPREPLC